MKPIDAFTIQAFTAVLPKLDVLLPQELKQIIHTTGNELAKHQFSEAAATMRDLVSRDRMLSRAYTPVYRKFQERYTNYLLGRSPVSSSASLDDQIAAEPQSEPQSEPQPEADFIPSEEDETLESSSYEWREDSPPNSQSESQSGSQSSSQSSSQPDSLASSSSLFESLFPEALVERMTVPILTANDFVLPARILIRRVKNQRERIPESMHLFVITLQRAVATFDEQTNRVLHLLEHQLLTLEDIAHALNMRPDQAERIVQMLLKEGYIDSARSNLLGRAMAVFMPAPRSHPDINPATQFVLTSKGFFHLNPLLTGRHSEEDLE